MRLHGLTPEQRKEFFREIGRRGGSVKTAKGFAVTGLAQEAGRKGGQASYTRKLGVFAEKPSAEKSAEDNN